MHDVILFYAMSGHNTFNVEYEPPSESTMKRYKGKRHKRDLKAKRNIYLDEPIKGLPMRDVWNLSVIAAVAKERMGYATQKPLALLNRIIETSTNEGDVVFGPLCGCATTLEAAHRLGRRWIGIDIAIHAVKRVARVRLQDRLGLVEGTDFEVQGVPRNVEGARDLWTQDKYHFQKWAVEEVDGFVTTKRTADGGVDRRLYFSLPDQHDLRSMVIEVKGGKSVAVESLRALRGVLETGVAELAGQIVMDPLGDAKVRNFRRFMAEAGDMDVMGVKYPRMQMISVPEILEGKRFVTPSVVGASVSCG